MKVLFTAPNLSLKGEWCASIGDELSRREDLEVITYSYRDYNTPLKQPDDDILSLYNKLKPDLFICIKGERFKPETIRKIKCKKIFFNNDDFQRFNENLMKEFDFVFTPSREFLPKYKELGIKADFLFYPVDTNIYKPMDLERKINVSFVGTYFPERVNYIGNLLKIPKFYFAGYGWLINNKPLPRISTEEYIRVLNQSKICFNKHQDIMVKVRSAVGTRIGEAMACRCLVLTDYCGEQYKDLRHLLVYKDVEEMGELIDYYLSNPEEANKIAEQGYIKVQEYSVEKFVDIILNNG